MRYLTLDELIYINGKLPGHRQILNGTKQVRDITLLESAVARPMHSVFGQDAYPTPQEKAAALLHAVARNHPFTDGNKRTATIAALFMLEANGLRAIWQPEAALSAILDLAEGKGSMADFAAWLLVEACPPLPEQDAAADMARIDDIMRRHDWLLQELAKR